jgi:hypothetical protein
LRNAIAPWANIECRSFDNKHPILNSLDVLNFGTGKTITTTARLNHGAHVLGRNVVEELHGHK